MKPIRWAYGVTTVPERADELLPHTLRSLANAGFDKPRLFVDGAKDARDYGRFSLEVTTRYPKIKTFGNWILALAELYIRNPTFNRFALFQDDFITYCNLKEYLTGCKYPEHGYWNLLTFMDNETLLPNADEGWMLSHQKGRGAVALVFNREAVITLLHQQHTIQKPMVAGWRKFRKIDGTIVEAFRQEGWQEYVHNPTLVQHTGDVSATGNSPHPQAKSFRGENFDALQFKNF